MGKTKPSKESLATPGVPLSQEEFVRAVREAEKGPFYTVDETAQMIEAWKLKYARLHTAKTL